MTTPNDFASPKEMSPRHANSSESLHNNHQLQQGAADQANNNNNIWKSTFMNQQQQQQQQQNSFAFTNPWSSNNADSTLSPPQQQQQSYNMDMDEDMLESFKRRKSSLVIPPSRAPAPNPFQYDQYNQYGPPQSQQQVPSQQQEINYSHQQQQQLYNAHQYGARLGPSMYQDFQRRQSMAASHLYPNGNGNNITNYLSLIHI